MKQILYKIIGLEEIKNNKFYFICKILLTLIFAITISLDSMIVFKGNIYGNINDIYFKNIEIKNILIFVISSIITYIFISLIEILVDKLENTIYTKKDRNYKNIKVYFIILAIILLCWLPTVLSYFPGGIYSDTVSSINQAMNKTPLNNDNPLLYAFILKVFISISSLQSAIELFTIFQILIMASVLSYSIYWLYKKGISIKYIVLITAFFGLFKLIPIYAISIWKDTPFCIAIFAFTLFIAETVYQDGKNLEKVKSNLIYILLLILLCFLRNNGIYIAVATTLVMMIVYRKSIFKNLKIFSVTSIISIILIYIIQGPIYKHFNLNGKIVESLGVPIQQLCYVVTQENGNITQDQLKFINEICPIDRIKETYNPCLLDTVKWNGSFNNQYLDENKIQFFKVWGKVLLQNPISYVKAYLLNTIGFWDVNKATFDAYINPQMWQNTDKIQIDQDNEIKQTDYIEKISGHSIRNIVTPSIAISSALFLFINLFSMIITIYKRKYKNILIYLPALLTWATIMIAVPLAFSLRYVYILVLILPLSFLIPFLKQKD